MATLSKLKSIKKKEYKGKVYDFCFKNEHYFYISSNVFESKCNLLIHNSFPDIDVDFMTDTDKVVDDFLYEKYGKERVLHVTTFSTFNEKQCLKDVTKALGQDAGFESEVFQVTKEMPDFSKVDFGLATWFTEWPKNTECSEVVRGWLTNIKNRKILEQTLKLQGQIKGIGQHAAGIVITPSPSWEHIPCNIIAKNASIVTAFQEADKSGKDLSSLGILKIDKLKLDTLNVISETIELVKKTKGIDIRDAIDFIDLEDKNLYDELKIGMNQGIFQFESMGMNKLIKNINIETFQELVAANALYRPGPLGIKAHEEFAKNKFAPHEIKYVHPSLEPILNKTNGVLIYQEQLMFIAHQIAGMTLGEGDNLRRGMDKAGKMIEKELKGLDLSQQERESKAYKEFRKYWVKFEEGAKRKGFNDVDLYNIKEWLIKYLGYSFNRSHSLSYSYLAAQTLYLKHYYPSEFYTSLLNHPKKGSGSNAKEKESQWLMSAIASAISKGIKILPPSKKSGWKWTMTGEKEISMGFSAINGVGDIAFEELFNEIKRFGKKFEEINMLEFFSVQFSKFNKKAFESCVKAGIFDDWANSREYLISLKEKKKNKKESKGQMLLFDINDENLFVKLDSNAFQETTQEQKRFEFLEVVGFDLMKIEEMAQIKQTLAEKAGRIIESITNYEEPDYYFFVVDTFKELTVQNGKNAGSKYGDLRIGDGINFIKVKIFGKSYEKLKPLLIKGGIYVSNFESTEKGYMNFQRDAKFKRIY